MVKVMFYIAEGDFDLLLFSSVYYDVPKLST